MESRQHKSCEYDPTDVEFPIRGPGTPRVGQFLRVYDGLRERRQARGVDHDGRPVVRELAHLVACEKLLEQWMSREWLEARDSALVWDVWADGAGVETRKEILRLGDKEHGDLQVVLLFEDL